jgi:hypothetical protein
MSDSNNQYYKDKRYVSSEQRMTRRYEKISTHAQLVSSILDKYKIRYIRNLDYILEFVGMSRGQFSKACVNLKISNPVSMMNAIAEGRYLYFDLKYPAILASYFSIPTDIVIDRDMREENINLMAFGLTKNCYKKKSSRIRSQHGMFAENRAVSIAKKCIVNNAYARARKPPRIFDAWEAVYKKRAA